MNEFRSIVYVSSAVPLPDEARLETLLREARALNLESSVTGVLLYGNGTFMQCLEGSPVAVEETYRRIRASRSHRGLIELIDCRVAERSFDEWQMGFSRASLSEILRLSTAQWLRQAGSTDSIGAVSAGMALLKDFWVRLPK